MTQAIDRPRHICLNMIVRNKAGIIHALIEPVADHIPA